MFLYFLKYNWIILKPKKRKLQELGEIIKFVSVVEGLCVCLQLVTPVLAVSLHFRVRLFVKIRPVCKDTAGK